MQTITTIGLDIAKSVFQVHGVDNDGKVVIRRQLKRRYVLAFFEKLQPCLVGIEACASSHHWSRELQALGHTVRLMPPAYVKPYVKRQKNDAADAEAICEAVTRTNMRFVPVKTPEQQSGLMLHRTRHLFIRQQTSVINAIRAHLAEFGVTAAVGRKGIEELLRVIADPSDKRVPDVVRACLAALGSQLLSLKKQILDFDRMIMAWHRSNQTSKRLNCIPGVGPLLATALVASVADLDLAAVDATPFVDHGEVCGVRLPDNAVARSRTAIRHRVTDLYLGIAGAGSVLASGKSQSTCENKARRGEASENRSVESHCLFVRPSRTSGEQQMRIVGAF